jgi:hypothetical protein
MIPIVKLQFAFIEQTLLPFGLPVIIKICYLKTVESLQELISDYQNRIVLNKN